MLSGDMPDAAGQKKGVGIKKRSSQRVRLLPFKEEEMSYLSSRLAASAKCSSATSTTEEEKKDNPQAAVISLTSASAASERISATA